MSATGNTSPPSHKAQNTAQAYANSASRAFNGQFTGRPTATALTTAKFRPQPKPYRIDDQLFVRIPEGNTLWDHSGYAIQAHMRAKFRKEGQTLTNVQLMKTVFTLCPKDRDSAKLMKKIKSIRFFGDAPVGKVRSMSRIRVARRRGSDLNPFTVLRVAVPCSRGLAYRAIRYILTSVFASENFRP